MIHRAYSILEVKEFDGEQRVIRGLATSPVPDRAGDIVEPMGVKVAPDIPLFLYHDSTKTVGRARFGKPTKAGIPFEATLPKISEPGLLKDRVDEAWQLVKYKLVTGVSIGFRVMNDAYERLKDGGIRFIETEVLELSIVPVPMHQLAQIETIKSADQAARRAALGAQRGMPVVRLDKPAHAGAASPGDSGAQPPRRKGVVYLN